jgi:hypothetical protein
MSTYDRYATTGSHIGIKYGWDWFGWLPSFNAGGSHENEVSMFMPYVLWGDWRNFESSEDKVFWTNLCAAVAYDQPDFNVNWHYLAAFPNTAGTGMATMRYPDWYKRAVWNRPDSGHCGMLQNLEYYYLTGDRHALEEVKYNAQLANFYLWPRFDKVPTWYSSYSGNVDDPNFQISDRYYAWPIFNLVQAYEATGETAWLADATIGIRGMRNTLRISPLKFANELIHPAGDSSLAYWNQWSPTVRATSASQGYANFCAPGIASKATGQYYLATGDMDALDLLIAAADFTCESGARRDTNGNVLGFYYAWGDYWGPSDPTTTTFHGDVANGLGMATQFARKAE